MKICINDDINTVIYINKEYSSDIDFSNELEIENYFKKVFNKLKTFYNISIKGFYNIDVYLDNYYGIVLNLEKENIDYYDYFDNHIDMQFRIKKYSSFLYKLNDLFDLSSQIKDKVIVYFYRNQIYAKIIKKIDYLNLGKLIENSQIIYDEKIDDIVKYGKIINW